MPFVNYDSKTSIFYGVISQRSISPYALEDILFSSDSRDLSYEYALKEFGDNLNTLIEYEDLKEFFNFVKEVFHVWRWSSLTPKTWEHDKRIFNSIKDCLVLFKQKEFEELKEYLTNEFNERYESPDDREFLYESEGYKIINCLYSDLMILESPYYTFAPACSPCVPEAGNLDSINIDRTYTKKTYCLGPDFYEEVAKPLYKIYEVKTSKEVINHEE